MLLFDTIVWPAVNLFGALAFLTVVAVSGLKAPQVVWFLALTALDLNEAAFSAKLERSDLRFVKLSFISRVYYNVLLDVNKFFALYDELRGTRMRWS